MSKVSRTLNTCTSCSIWDVSSSTKPEQWLRLGQRPIFSKEGKRDSLLLILMRQPRVKLDPLSGKDPHICYFMEKFFWIFWDKVSSARPADPLPLFSSAGTTGAHCLAQCPWKVSWCESRSAVGWNRATEWSRAAHTKLENTLWRKKLEDINHMT